MKDFTAHVRPLIADVPGWLNDLIVRLLAKKPEDRPDTARQVAVALLFVAAHQSPIGRPEPSAFDGSHLAVLQLDLAES